MSLRETVISLLHEPKSAKAIVDMLSDLVTHGIHGALLYDKNGNLVYVPVRWSNNSTDLDDSEN